jgi:hypothetical protein
MDLFDKREFVLVFVAAALLIGLGFLLDLADDTKGHVTCFSPSGEVLFQDKVTLIGENTYKKDGKKFWLNLPCLFAADED